MKGQNTPILWCVMVFCTALPVLAHWEGAFLFDMGLMLGYNKYAAKFYNLPKIATAARRFGTPAEAADFLFKSHN